MRERVADGPVSLRVESREVIADGSLMIDIGEIIGKVGAVLSDGPAGDGSTGIAPRCRRGLGKVCGRFLVESGLGPALEDTFLIKAEGSRLAILSLWRRRADLDALLASGEEPPARRLIRTHGGDPQVTLWEVVIRGSEFASSEG